MIVEFIRLLKYIFAGCMIAHFVTGARMQAGAQVTAESMLVSGAIFMVLVVLITIYQIAITRRSLRRL